MLAHRQPHRTVAHRAPEELQAVGGESALEAEVAHHRGHDAAAGESVRGPEMARPDEQDVVAVEHGARLVHQHHAVGVAVEGEAGVGLERHAPGRRGGRARWRRTAG